MLLKPKCWIHVNEKFRVTGGMECGKLKMIWKLIFNVNNTVHPWKGRSLSVQRKRRLSGEVILDFPRGSHA